MDPLEGYRLLREQVDAEAARLTALHGDDIVCREGCAACCTNLTVFPVEFFAILREMERDGVDRPRIPFDTTAPCGFLHEGLCRIYRYRPIICRTHGLPILFLDDTGGALRWEVSFCEKNFTGPGPHEFTDETVLDVEELNAMLSHLNHAFVSALPEKKYHELSRIPLKELTTYREKP